MFRLREYDVAGSTNEVVKAALREGEAEGLAVTARVQTGGYGRQGRMWASPEGGLYLSVLLRPHVPAERLSTLSLAVGVAVRRACVSLAGGEASRAILLKWPNDLVVSATPSAGCADVDTEVQFAEPPAAMPFFKLCGISLEALCGGVCVGVGVNVVPPEKQVALEGRNVPAYLADWGCANIDAVRCAVLREMEEAYRIWCAEGFAPFVEEFCQHDALAGRQVRLADQRGEAVAIGTACGVDDGGHLLVKTSHGTVPCSSGEAHLV